MENSMEIDNEVPILIPSGYLTAGPRYPTLPPIIDENDWLYPMRRTMQEIIPRLFLGPYASACRSKLNDMKEAGITHVVCVRAPIEAHLISPNHPEHFQYLVIDMDDSVFELVIPKLKTVIPFIDNALNSGGKVLVHGNAGMSRSPIFVVGYIMSKFGVSFKKANKYVQSKRFCICISDSSARQLNDYEALYRAMHTTAPTNVPGMTCTQFQSLKRTIDEILDDEDEESTTRPRTDKTNNMELD